MILHPNAKINIGLNITERRADGYHNLETVFYPINIQDRLEVKLSDTDETHFSISGIPVDGNQTDNLVLKAYRLLKDKFDLPAVDVSLEKNIPLGAGLGGGSADAAFMLKALNQLFELQLSVKELEELATKLGADCPFFIQNKPTLATGIGNVFTDVDVSLKGYWLLLIKPEVHISTAEAYSGVKPMKPEKSLADLIKQPIELWKESIVNDFEKHIFELYPQVGAVKDNLYETGAIYAAMSGSGSSVYGIFKEKPTDLYFIENQFFEIIAL